MSSNFNHMDKLCEHIEHQENTLLVNCFIPQDTAGDLKEKLLLSFAESMLFTNRGVWQPCMEQGDRCRFSKSIHSPGFSVSHSGNSQCFKPSTKKHGSSLKAQIMVCTFKQ